MTIKSKDPLISIITPSFNHGIFLDSGINSILRQTYKNWELIIIDDASTDNTPEIVSQVIRENKNKKIRYYRNHKNMGLTYTLNKGIQKAKGDFCCVLDADDYLPETSLERRIKSIGNADAVITDMIKIETNKNRALLKEIPTDHKSIYKFISDRNSKGNINTNTLLIRISVFKKIGFRSFKYSSHSDYDFVLKLLLNCSVIYGSFNSYFYVQRESSMSQKAYHNPTELKIQRRMLENYKKKFSSSLKRLRT